MANRGYDVVVDVDTEGDLGHTDLQEDNLEFHSSKKKNGESLGGTLNQSEQKRKDFDADANSKIQPDNTPFLSSSTNPSNLPNNAGNDLSSSSSASKRYLWSIHFYAQFFDVDTSTVLTRCRAALVPFLPNTAPFLDTLDGNPDLYGPFWIATTVVMILFLTGTISQYLARQEKGHFEYDFKLLSGAAGLIYGYTAIVPACLWAVLKWFGAQGVELVECWALYGYANLIWIAVALLSWSPLTALNYVLVGLGFALSVFFLVKNLQPVISATEKKTSQVLLIGMVLLHAGLAIAIKILFFAHASPARKDQGGQDKAGDDRLKMVL